MHDDPLPSGLTEGPGELTSLPPAPGAPYTASAVFTGQGGEYFRIWDVNILLTLVRIHERVRFGPIWEYIWPSWVGPRVEEPALMLINPYPWSAPLEEVRLKKK